MKLSELSPEARSFALDASRYDALNGWSWWEYVYEDAKRMGKLLGIEVDEIRFDDHYAVIAGRYDFNPKCLAEVTAEAPQDQELKRIASVLTELNMEAFLSLGSTLRASISYRGNRPGLTVTTSVPDEVDGYEDLVEGPSTQRFVETIHDFTRWIHKSLMDEEAFQLSDQATEERISDCEFDEFGRII